MKISVKKVPQFLLIVCIACLACAFKNGLKRNDIQRSSRDQIHSLQGAIDRLILNFEPNAHIGIEIVSVKTGQKLYQKNANQLFVPASNLKLFTGAAALAILGQDYRFETRLLTDGDIRGNILRGNLFLKGSGNPEFSLDHLEEMVFQLKLNQIEHISGDLIADNTDFDSISQGPGWMWDEGAEYWNSPMDALTVNHSCMKLWIRPASEVSRPPMVYIYPKTSYVSVQNSALTVEKEGTLKVGRQGMAQQNVIEIKGSLPIKKTHQEYMVPVETPHLYAIHLLKDLLSKYGIRLDGSIKVQQTPSSARIVAVHHSAPLGVMIRNMMKQSDNLAADCFFKKLGQTRYGSPGTWQNGGQAMKEFLTNQVGIDVSEMVMLDGCGLSRYNLVSPHQIASFLTWMQKQHKFCAEFMSSLPIAGTDGYLKHRMKENNTRGNVRAKGGSMTGVTSLSGYVNTKDGDLLAFSIMINGFVKPIKDYKNQLEDQICLVLSQFSYH
ncbi:MAG TPA: D-alanyl-D-alanine carboxypeptidase/D-alanyl-D-alanine-endopeptidase [Rhabdochlamydiaceae bacterium]|nr:D-alanyl-D-alanine carboxypeptidase/D-alanyl-D-alanine-endopeptidase [Rhabdochlamydiaceae bacterium]